MKHQKVASAATPLARNNKTAMMAHFIDSLVIIIFCILQATAALVTWNYVLITLVLGLGPVLIERICWKKNHETPAIKHLASIGFAVFYTFILFTATNQLVFVFVVPMVLMISIYNDMRASLMITVGIIVENILAVSIGATTGKLGYLGRDYAVIQVVFVILVGVYSIFTTKTLHSNFKQVLSDLASVSEQMKTGIEDINLDLLRLNDASASTINAMQEVSTGTNDTAEAVQSQLLQTQEIQSKVNLVSASTDRITDHMRETLSILEQGNKNVSVLVEKVDASVQSGVDVAEKLHILEQSVTEMNSIVEFISTIARETGLLALNARIEASHAGNFGKGFAVVASEFSDMATQTKEATTHIADLIENTSSGINEVVTVIYQMIDSIQEEKQSTDSTADSFSLIQESTLSIRDNVEILTGHIQDLKEANNLITDSIETISAVSEEVSAHAAETTSAEEESTAILTRIDNRMHELLEVIKQ